MNRNGDSNQAMAVISPSNSRVLSKFWHPLIYEKDLPKDKPVSVELIGKKLVVYRAQASVVVADEQCPHRGTSLSLGHMAGGALRCAYHGLTFGASGECQNSRQRCPTASEDALRLTTFRSSTRYGIVWTCLDPSSSHHIPDFSEYGDPSYSSLRLAPLQWNASPIRQVEGVFDLAHFYYVHQASGCSMLGSGEEIPPHTIRRKGGVIHVEFQPANNGDCGFWDRVYRITLPFTVQMAARRTVTGYWTIFNTVCPVSETKSRIFVIQAFNFNKKAIMASMRSYEEKVYEEDRRVVESQTPVVPHLDFRGEHSLPKTESPSCTEKR